MISSVAQTVGFCSNAPLVLLFLGTEFAFRDWLVVGLSYRYGARRLYGGNITVGGVHEFTDNQVMLTLTASPALRF